jgi:L-malate glycosyltransferase
MSLKDVTVLFVIDHYSGTDGGTERQLLELIRGLSWQGLVPHLAVLRSSEFSRELGSSICPMTTLNIKRLASIGTLYRLIRLSWFIRKNKIRLVHVFFNDAALAIPFFAKLGGARVVVSRRDMGTWYTPTNLKLLRIVNRFVDRIIANSRAVADHVVRSERAEPGKVHVIYNGFAFERGVDPARVGFRESLGLGESDPIIGMVANLKPLKRHADALHAFALVRRSHPTAHLVLVGTGRLREQLHALARELGIEECVHFLGNPPEVIPVVKHFNVALLCSESEGFSNALLEYMACGVPPVCTRVGGNVELVREGIDGYLVELGDVVSLASRVATLLADPALARKLGENARKTAENYTVDKMVAAHLVSYSELLNGKGTANAEVPKPMLRVERASIERFHESRVEWNRLVDVMYRPSTFCTWEWVHTWWKHFGGPYELLLLFIYREDALVGIFPLSSRLMWIEDAVMPGRALGFCGSTELYSDHMDVICAEKDAMECMDAVMAYLDRDFQGWDVLQLSHVAEDAKCLEFISGRKVPFDVRTRAVSTAAYIPLEGGFTGFLETLSRGGRHNLKRARSILHEQYGAVYEGCDSDAVAKAMREMFELHGRRAAQKGTRTNFQGERLTRFHAEIAELVDAAGHLHLRFLRHNGQPIAGWYCFNLGGRIFTYQQGFDPEWEKRSVARVLLFELIEEACQEGITEIDMLRGGWEYKSHWTSHRRELINVNVYNDTPVGRLIRETNRGRNALAAGVKGLRAGSMRFFNKLRDIPRRHPVSLLASVFNRIPFRPVQILYFQRYELNGSPPARRQTGSAPTRLADRRDLEALVRCQDKRAIFEQRFAAGEHCIVATVDGSVVAYEWFSAKSEQTEERYGYTIPIPGDALYSYDAYTSESFRGRGIWKQIIAGAAELMKGEQRNRLIAHIDFGNDISMTAHAKVGFRPIGRYLFLNVFGARLLKQTWSAPPPEAGSSSPVSPG